MHLCYNKRMRKYLLFAVAVLIGYGCVNNHTKVVERNAEKDALTAKKRQEELIDSLSVEAGDRPDREQDPPSMQEERDKFIKSYNSIVKIDTLLIEGNDSLNLSLKYYCQKDRNLIIPKNYVFEEKDPKDFLTHPFACDIKLVQHGKTIFEKTIRRNNFDVVLSEQLKKYGILTEPYSPKYNQETGDVILAYSISIPVTDIGIGVQIKINKNGTFTLVKD